MQSETAWSFANRRGAVGEQMYRSDSALYIGLDVEDAVLVVGESLIDIRIQVESGPRVAHRDSIRLHREGCFPLWFRAVTSVQRMVIEVQFLPQP